MALEAGARRRSSARPGAGSTLTAATTAMAVVAVLATFLTAYALRGRPTPNGSDTLQDVWRARVVAAGGLDALPDRGVNAVDAGVDRPGLALLLAVQQGIGGIAPETAAFGLPAAMAAALALAAGAFAVGVLRRPAWALGLVALVVGTSVQTELLADGYFDNLCAAVVITAAFALALTGGDAPSTRRRTWVGAVILLAAGVLYHWQFAAYAAGLLLVTAAWRVLRPPEDRAEESEGPSAGRIAAVVLVAGGLGAALLALASRGLLGPHLPERDELIGKLSRLYPVLLVPVVAILVLAGLWSLRGVRGTALAGRRLLVAWLASAAVGSLLLAVGSTVPAHRLVAFAFAIPILAGLAIERLLAVGGPSPGSAAPWIGRALAVLVLAGGIVVTEAIWWGRPPAIEAGALPALQRVAATIDGVAVERPVVVVVDAPALPDLGVATAVRRIRALIEPSHIEQVHFFLGDVADALAGRPTRRPADRAFTQLATLLWPDVGPVLGHDPVVVVSGLYDRAITEVVAAHPEASHVPGLVVIRGAIAPPIPVTPAVGAARAVRGAVLLLVLVGVAGLGWAWSLGPRSLVERLALAPALGTAAIALAAFLVDRAGLVVGRPAVAWTVGLAVAAAGWIPWALRRFAATP